MGKKSGGKTHLVIPDSHVEPGISNTRFNWLGKLIMALRPDTIICLGDFADMSSLSSYDRGRKSYEGRRYKKDCDAVAEAMALLHGPIVAHNKRCAKNKKAQYIPRKVMTLGNHEQRIVRVTEMHPELDGTISIDDLKYEEWGWEVYDYMQPVEIDGVYYSHSFPSGVKGDPISGFNIASQLLMKQMVSTTVGHIHLLDTAVRSYPTGQKVRGLSAGCFVSHVPAYATAQAYLWWSGVVVKHNVKNGNYSLEEWSLDRIKEAYGK